MKGREYQICTRCVMDTTDPDIVFDEKGRCNHCTNALNKIYQEYSDPLQNKKKLIEIISTVKAAGKNQKYDCIIGLSGGVDSSYLAYELVNTHGVRPLAVHVDNGWNSEIAVGNIHAIVNQLNIDLVTHVIDWEEFKDLQRAFLRASVIDLEMLSDHAIVVITKRFAQKKKIKYFLIGSNFQTESIMPDSWFYAWKHDSGNIKDIHNKYGDIKKLKTFPFLSFYSFLRFRNGYGKYLSPLSFIPYNKDEAKQKLQNELGWKDYGAKHNESFVTKFYQNYILPKKFNVDKRRAHFSSLICSGQIDRQSAIEELGKPSYNSLSEEYASVDYFCKKIGFSRAEFDNIIVADEIKHKNYKSYSKRKDQISKIVRLLIKK